MKSKSITSILAAALLAPGALFATTATTIPVGYETLSVSSGFNYLGLRLHQAVAFSGTFDSQTGSTLTDNEADFSSATPSAVYIVELANGKMIETPGSFLISDSVTGLSGIVAGDLGTYSIRPAATLSSVFGSANTAGLKAGSLGSSDADQIWVPDGMGDFKRYYFDDFNPNSFEATWSELDAPNNPVDAATVFLPYIDGIIIIKDGASTLANLTVSGSVKMTKTVVGVPAGFNYLSSIYPAGATVANSYGVANTANFKAGSLGSSEADQVWLPDGSGDFLRYYYDSFNPNTFEATWSELEAPNNAADPTLISLTSGLIVVADEAVDLTFEVPSFYVTP